MSLGRIKARLRALINRKDFTDALAEDFIFDAMVDLERELRIGPMETLTGRENWDGVRDAFAIPTDYLELVNFFTDEGELEQKDLDFVLRMPREGPRPKVFVKVADRWLLRPTPKPGTTVFLHYYSSLPRPANDTDGNAWTDAGFLATLYTAAALAADFYQMESEQHADRYRALAADCKAKLASQDLDEKWSGRMAIHPPQNLGEF